MEDLEEHITDFTTIVTCCIIALIFLFKVIIMISWEDVSEEQKFVKNGDVLTLNKDSGKIVLGKYRNNYDKIVYVFKVRRNNGIVEIIDSKDAKFIETNDEPPQFGRFEKHVLEKNSITGEEQTYIDVVKYDVLVVPEDYEIVDVDKKEYEVK